MKKTICYCDLCNELSDETNEISMPIFLSGDGRNKIIRYHRLDLCPNCIEKAVTIELKGDEYDFRTNI